MADDFNSPTLDANPCEFSVSLPSLPSLSISIPSISLPSLLPTFNLSLALSCNLDKPIDVSGGLSYGGGREAEFDPDPDDSDE